MDGQRQTRGEEAGRAAATYQVPVEKSSQDASSVPPRNRTSLREKGRGGGDKAKPKNNKERVGLVGSQDKRSIFSRLSRHAGKGRKVQKNRAEKVR